MDYIITKQRDAERGNFVYTVMDETGRTVGTRLSGTRDYVACLIQETNTGARVLTKWFRKLDQVGYGTSSKLIWKPGIKVAYWFGVFNKQQHEKAA